MRVLKNIFGKDAKISANDIAYDNGYLALDDTGWVDLTFASPLGNFGGDNTSRPRIRRVGSDVTLIGVATPTSSINAGASTSFIKNIPDEFRPPLGNINFPRMQGSGQNSWLMQYGDGDFIISRYGVANLIDIPVGAWLPFIVSYKV